MQSSCCEQDVCMLVIHRELQTTRDLIEHQVNAVKGEMQEKLESLSADAVRLDLVVSMAEQMRSVCCMLFTVRPAMPVWY